MEGTTMREGQADALLDGLRGARRKGERALEVFSRDGSLHLAVWRNPRPEIDEIDLGPGPFRRPSVAGFQEMWATERANVQPEFFLEGPDEASASGYGLHDMPLGPVRADVAEALRYELRCLGDEIFSVRLVDGFKRRSVRGLMEGLAPHRALEIAERVTGTSPVAHAAAFSMAVEAALGIEVPGETARRRVLLGEMERLASHLGDLAALAASTGTPVAAAELYRLKDAVLRYGLGWTGHRYLRGVVAPGGERRGLHSSADDLRALRKMVDAEFSAIRAMLDRMTSFLDRLHGAGRVPPGFDGLVGFVGRAAGGSEDVRWDRPYFAYPEVVQGVRPPRHTAADAHARYLVRCEEIDFSLSALGRLAESVAGDAQACELPQDGAQTHGWGLVEAPRGRLAYRVELARGEVRDVHIVTASAVNWPAVPAAVSNHNILQDFPIVDASFNLCVAALDL